jgi:hypothetical protein
MTINKPVTVFIRFIHELPMKFILSNERGEVVFFRYLDGRTPRIKFNILEPGEYSGNVAFEVLKKEQLQKPFNLPDLPQPERNRRKDFKLVDNFSLIGTPARIYSEGYDGNSQPVIELSRSYYDYPKAIQDFILEHEKGHLLYKTEEKADLYALVNCLKKGHNRSMCFYALSHILKKSPANMERLKSLLNNIQKTQNNSL